jgi:hypothetical protein
MRVWVRSIRAAILVALGGLGGACENDEPVVRGALEPLTDSASAARRLDAVRQMFGDAVLRPGDVTRWQPDGADRVNAVAESIAGSSPATVRVPTRASGTVELTDVGSKVEFRGP